LLRVEKKLAMTEEEPISAEEAPRKKKWWGRALRAAVSLALLVWLLKGVDWSAFAGLVRQADPLYAGIALLLVVVAVILSAYKWQRLLTVQRVEIPWYRLFIFYLVGLFFNNFLPTNIGGDVVRMHDAARYSGKTPEAIASVIAERLLALTAAAGLMLSFQTSQRFGWLVLGVLAAAVAALLVFAVEKWRAALGKKIKLPQKFSINRYLKGLGSSIGCCLQNRSNTAYIVFLSVLFQISVVAVTYFIFLALKLDVPFVYCVLVIPIISALQMLPVSISGFGVREGAYVFFFNAYGVSSTEAIAASLAFWILVALVSLSGGAIFALRK
jgi:uncharacterized protein (TIRG00374 family)